jgi:hypothetical protein
LDSFGYVLGTDRGDGVDIGDGAGNLQDAVVGAGGKSEPANGL